MGFLNLIFRDDPWAGRYALHTSMAGLQMGNRLLQVGCGNGELFAALGTTLGLTGRACAVDEDAAPAARARDEALKAGVLAEVEVTPYRALPFEEDAFDLVLVQIPLADLTPEDRVGCLQEAYRVTRPGGRCMVVEPAPRGGLPGLVRHRAQNPHYLAGGGTAGALSAEGFKGVRLLAQRAGVSFIEGAKPRPGA